MKRAAIGIRAHSGWGALVAVTGNASFVQVLDRKRVEVIDRATVGAAQPFHFAEKLKLAEAEKHIAACAATSEQIASAALEPITKELRDRGYEIAGCAILLASGRPLPDLEKILASHALIHTAEGEFFRRAFRTACEGLGLLVEGVRERDLPTRIETAISQEIARMGRIIWPPWTTDQKNAAMAAMSLLLP